MAAAGILAVGYWAKPVQAGPPAVAENDLARLTNLTQRRQLEDRQRFFQRLANDAAVSLAWLPGPQRAALVWTPTLLVGPPGVAAGPVPVQFPGRRVMATADSLAADTPVSSVRLGSPVTQTSATLSPELRPGVLVVAVTRNREGVALWVSGQALSRRPARCGTLPYELLHLSFLLPAEFQGGGLFDLDGRLVATIGGCQGQTVAVPADGVPELVARSVPVLTAVTAAGLTVQPLDEAGRAATQLEAGLLVTSVRPATPAAQAPLQPGDVLQRAGGVELRELTQLEQALAAGERGLTVWRRGRAVTLALPRPPDRPELLPGWGVALAGGPARVEVSEIERGSPLYEGGMRRGDRLLGIAGRSVNQPSAAERSLTALRGPALVEWERDGARHAAVVQPPRERAAPERTP